VRRSVRADQAADRASCKRWIGFAEAAPLVGSACRSYLSRKAQPESPDWAASQQVHIDQGQTDDILFWLWATLRTQISLTLRTQISHSST
jgi:hypothetical protein